MDAGWVGPNGLPLDKPGPLGTGWADVVYSGPPRALPVRPEKKDEPTWMSLSAAGRSWRGVGQGVRGELGASCGSRVREPRGPEEKSSCGPGLWRQTAGEKWPSELRVSVRVRAPGFRGRVLTTGGTTSIPYSTTIENGGNNPSILLEEATPPTLTYSQPPPPTYTPLSLTSLGAHWAYSGASSVHLPSSASSGAPLAYSGTPLPYVPLLPTYAPLATVDPLPWVLLTHVSESKVALTLGWLTSRRPLRQYKPPIRYTYRRSIRQISLFHIRQIPTVDPTVTAPPLLHMLAPGPIYTTPPPIIFPTSSAYAPAHNTEPFPFPTLQPQMSLSRQALLPQNITLLDLSTHPHVASLAPPTNSLPATETEQE
ncbi:hypothetical protein CRG98_003412 [Punica granatum]|uniref:Extensin-like n=1 Tax=Punica granatum TaxID=22663 RepID=A0A2I0L642_PUNGR|nr:hypothetical protein CRG98_003412 [Punica granatum]